jgi:hypothetical protein
MGPRGLRRRRTTTLMPLADALAALGGDGTMGRHEEVVPLTTVVGSASRSVDFDADFHLINPALRQRREAVSAMMRAGRHPAPVELVQLGELYFVRDGHHRVSAAKALGWDSLPARVIRVCTVAYAMSCLRTAHLPSKAAERRFLERVPLPDDVRRDLWLDQPADWARLADSAEAWAHRTHSSRRASLTAPELAATWWREEVTPVLDRLRTVAAPELRDVQLYVTARSRCETGSGRWPGPKTSPSRSPTDDAPCPCRTTPIHRCALCDRMADGSATASARFLELLECLARQPCGVGPRRSAADRWRVGPSMSSRGRQPRVGTGSRRCRVNFCSASTSIERFSRWRVGLSRWSSRAR